MNSLFENSWFMFSIVAVAVMVLVGTMQYAVKMNTKTKNFGLYLHRRYNQKFFRFSAVVLGVVFTVLLVKDSSNGIIQLMDDIALAGEDDSAWSVILMLMAVSISGCVFTGMLYVVGVLMGEESRKANFSKMLAMCNND